jgi:hypothetical protein
MTILRRLGIVRFGRLGRLHLTVLLLLALPLTLAAAAGPRTETLKIEALIKGLENLKGATFLRNGSEYDAKTAARFLHGKWQKHSKEIQTAAEFIDKIASASSTSGKAYQIRFPDGRVVLSGAFLTEELKKLEPEP